VRKIAWQGLLAGVVCAAIFIAAVGTGISWKRLHYEEGPSLKVSKEDEQLLDAVMYAFTGIEDNRRASASSRPTCAELSTYSAAAGGS
jgi:hypothetical protein